jgi:WXG100 family type VII secretion target
MTSPMTTPMPHPLPGPTAPPGAAGGARFGASLDVMAQAAAHVRGVNEEIGTLLSTLMSQLEPIASTWKGAASSAFQQLHQRWNSDAQKLNAALGGIAESLVATHRTYTASEDANTAAVSRVAGLING